MRTIACKADMTRLPQKPLRLLSARLLLLFLLGSRLVAQESKPFVIPRSDVSEPTFCRLAEIPGTGFLRRASPPPLTTPTLVVLVEFDDVVGRGTQSAWHNRIFGSENSVRLYFREVSYYVEGLRGHDIYPAPESSVVPDNGVVGWYKIRWGPDGNNYGRHPSVVAEDQGIDKWEKEFAIYVVDAAIRAAANDVDFARFDENSDRYLSSDELHVIIVLAGFEWTTVTSAGTSRKWSTWRRHGKLRGSSITVDSVTLFEHEIPNSDVGGGFSILGEVDYNEQNAPTFMIQAGLIAHELGHDLGLPDLYDRTQDEDSAGIGVWGLMASGDGLGEPSGASPSHLCAWSKVFLRWVEPLIVTNDLLNQTIHEVESNPEIFLLPIVGPNSTSVEYFLVENRQKTGYDKELPHGGLLIWHVNPLKLGNGNNDDETQKLVDLECADQMLEGHVPNADPLDAEESGTARNPWYAPNKVNFRTKGKSIPDSRDYEDNATFVQVLNISESASAMTADLIVTKLIPSPARVLISSSPQAIVADGMSTAVLAAEIQDSEGNLIEDATNPVTFTLASGTQSARLVGNNPATPENGAATITLQSTTTPGVVTVEASAQGLTSSSTSVVVYTAGNETEVSGRISSNTTWTVANSPYVVTGDIYIDRGVKLTIEPGVTVKLNREKNIVVEGGLFADGRPNAKIVFTANSSSPTPAFWGGIEFRLTATDSLCVLNHVVITYAGATRFGVDHPIVLHPVVNPRIDHLTLAHNRTNGIALVSGLHTTPIRLDVTTVPYMLFNDLTIHRGSELVIEPGVTVKMGNEAIDLIVLGRLVAKGTALKPIVFTSFRDDAHGGDTNGDGPSTAAPADWGGIHLDWTSDDKPRSMQFCQVLYGGAKRLGVDYPIWLDPRVDAEIRHTTLSQNRIDGIGLEGGQYSSDMHLDITGLPYVVPDLTVKAGAVLSVAPGALLKMLPGADLTVYGGFVAEGTRTRPIVFTSLADDTRLGDTNGNGDSAGSPGDWGGIVFGATADSANLRMNYCEVYFAGQGGFGASDAPIVLDPRANPKIASVRLEQNTLNGIDLLAGTYRSDILLDIRALPYLVRRDLKVDAGATLRIAPGVLLKMGPGTDVFVQGGLVADGSEQQPIVFTSLRDDSRSGDTNADGNTVGRPGDWGGIRFDASTLDGNAVLRNCEIHFAGQGGFGNNRAPIVLDARANPVLENVTLQDNRVNGVWLIDQGYNVNIELDVTDLPYIVPGDITIATGAQLKIHPGALFKMGGGTDFHIEGTLRVEGTPNRPIVFTSIRDDSRGGDTDGLGPTSGAPGDWGGILFRDASDDLASSVEYAEFYFAGQGGFGTNDSPLAFDGASPKIENVILSDTKSHGIRCSNNASPDLGGGARGSLGQNRLLGFVNQSDKYALISSGADVYARFNYWETADTTLLEAMIFDRQDDARRGRVFYEPFVGAVTLADFQVTPFPAKVGSPITLSGRVELNGQAQQVDMAVEDPVSLATRMVNVQSDGRFSYTTTRPVDHVDTYLFHFGALGARFETVVVPTRLEEAAGTSAQKRFNIPLLSAKLAFEVGKLGKFIGLDSPINILGEKIQLSGAAREVEEEVFSELLSAKKEFLKQFSNNLEFLYKERNQIVVSEGVTALVTILAGGGIDLRGILAANAELVSEAVIVSSVQALLDAIGQNSPEMQQFLQRPGVIVSLVSLQGRRGISATNISVLQALLSSDDVEEITIQELERRHDGRITSLILQILSKAGERFGLVLAEHGTGNMVSIIGNSPIDLVVQDPEGRFISKETQQIPKAGYAEVDIDGDGEAEDEIVIFDAVGGNYSVQVVPEANADPSATYSVLFVADGITTVLAQDVAIRDIPAEPYNTDYTTDVAEATTPALPEQFLLSQNYPNPFNPTTTFEFALPKPARVTLRIYNLRGQEIRTLVDAQKAAGRHRVTWNGEDRHGNRVASGVYVYQLKTEEFVATRKLILLR